MSNNCIIKNSFSFEYSIVNESLKFPSRNMYHAVKNYSDHVKELVSAGLDQPNAISLSFHIL
ncbi:MAG: hypothetical protein ACJZ19_05835 [Candidatus Neomarinimicrobiota bacterium]